MFIRSFFELAVLFGRLANPPFYGYGLCNKSNQTGIKFNELGGLILNLPLSAINFKGLLNFNKPFFRTSIAFMRDSMRDVLKNACGLPVDA